MKFNLVVLSGLLIASYNVAAADADDFAKLTPQQALKQANKWYGSDEGTSVQVFPDYVLGRFASGKDVKIPVKGMHLVSIAPYIDKMHPCTFHVPTGCTGELKSTALVVKIVDLETDQVLKYGEIKTNPNGFVDFWMPKNKSELAFTFEYQGKKASKVLSTGSKDATCITDMQLI